MPSRLKQIPESLLVTLWKERASREESLRAGNGRRFRVIYPGRIGTTAGPDFRDAVLEEEGVGLVRGDVEVHVRQRDWTAHGHDNDPRYNGVVLHVVASMDEAHSTLQSGGRVPVLSLESLLHSQPSSETKQHLWPLLKAHCYVPPENATEMGALLDRAGDSRFLGESAAFLGLLKEENPEQVLYAALMEALGYSQNRGPFLELADRVPYRLLRKVTMESLTEGRPGLIQELLLTAAGFLPSSPNTKAISLDRWHLFRVRPHNHPRRRIIGFSYVLNLFLPSSVASALDPPWAKQGLVEGMTCLVRASSSPDGNRGCWRALEGGLMGVCAPFPESNTDDRDKKQALIGRGRARDMAVNCVLPFLHALAQLNGDAELAQLSLKVYGKFPRLQENELTREMRQQLLSHLPTVDAAYPRELADKDKGDWEQVVCNARRQQGLLHLHHLVTSPVTL